MLRIVKGLRRSGRVQWTGRTIWKTRLHLFTFGSLRDGTQRSVYAMRLLYCWVTAQSSGFSQAGSQNVHQAGLELATLPASVYHVRAVLFSSFLNLGQDGLICELLFSSFHRQTSASAPPHSLLCRSNDITSIETCLKFSPPLFSSHPCFFFSPFSSLLLGTKPGASSKLSIHSATGLPALTWSLIRVQ